MFGRTGAPTEGAANFLHAGNTKIMGDSRVNESDEQKKGRQFLPRCMECSRGIAMGMFGWGRPLIPEILGQPARVGAKSPILNR